MNETAQMWMEISFNLLYLVVVWWLVAAMQRRLPQVADSDRKIGRYFIWAFALLALGDTGHVGFRVLAYALGGLETSLSLGSLQIGLVGLGALSTAITVTLFYVLVLFIWQERFEQPLGWFGGLLIASAGVRLVVMALPGNQWNSVVPPQPMSLVRNLFLTISGLGVAYLILRDAAKAGDRVFTWIGVSILVSYAFYIPVILFVQVAPLIGMLMIPKTLAYVAIALIAYQNLFRGRERVQVAVSG
jgi:hypothetical protein